MTEYTTAATTAAEAVILDAAVAPVIDRAYPAVRTDGPAAEALAAQLLAAVELAPDTEGLWRVWGACPSTIEVGDVVVNLDGDTMVIEEVAAITDTLVGVSITTPSGAKFRMGGLFRGFQLYRPGTHATLAR